MTASTSKSHCRPPQWLNGPGNVEVPVTGILGATAPVAVAHFVGVAVALTIGAALVVALACGVGVGVPLAKDMASRGVGVGVRHHNVGVGVRHHNVGVGVRHHNVGVGVGHKEVGDTEPHISRQTSSKYMAVRPPAPSL